MVLRQHHKRAGPACFIFTVNQQSSRGGVIRNADLDRIGCIHSGLSRIYRIRALVKLSCYPIIIVSAYKQSRFVCTTNPWCINIKRAAIISGYIIYG